MNNKRHISLALLLAFAGMAVATVPSFAAGTNDSSDHFNNKMMVRGIHDMKPILFGQVSAVNGNTITVVGKQETGFGDKKKTNTTTISASTTFAVDVTNAKIIKNNATSTASGILVGDTVMVQGTITGTNVVATMVHDGIMRGRGDMKMWKDGTDANFPVQGNGQPVVAGTISAITGSTITLTTKSNTTFTIDATNAKVTQGQSVSTLAALAVGNAVVVQGTVNGSSIVASSIMAQAKITNTNDSNSSQDGNKGRGGFFGGIGQFFSRLFGF
jgi:hypothetical protein